MKRNRLILLFVACSLALLSCRKNYTRFFGDSVEEGLSVFSDKGYNVMSCYINGEPYRTKNREAYSGWRDGVSYEIYVNKEASDTAESLIFSWGKIKLVLIKEKFTIDDFRRLENQRVPIDGTNGYFQVDAERGTGTIYFHKAGLAEAPTGGFGGYISGLFEISTPSATITHGRFDHSLDGNIHFYY